MTRAMAVLAQGSVLDDGSRMIVVSWMVEVAEEFGLQQETLHAAVSLLDRFLSTSNVSRRLRTRWRAAIWGWRDDGGLPPHALACLRATAHPTQTARIVRSQMQLAPLAAVVLAATAGCGARADDPLPPLPPACTSPPCPHA